MNAVIMYMTNLTNTNVYLVATVCCRPCNKLLQQGINAGPADQVFLS